MNLLFVPGVLILASRLVVVVRRNLLRFVGSVAGVVHYESTILHKTVVWIGILSQRLETVVIIRNI